MSSLITVMYHYVRDVKNSPFKGIHAVGEMDFIDQVRVLKQQYEMATISSLLDFLKGRYKPTKDLCVLTFDDGLKEHGNFVMEILSKEGIEGQFFIPTSPIEDKIVLPVHMNHFLLAALDFSYYRKQFIERLHDLYSDLDLSINPESVKQTYRWDNEEVASFKYLINYQIPSKIRDEVLKIVFEEELGNEQKFASDLYLNWKQIRNMQNNDMVIGGHGHTHVVLSQLSEENQKYEIFNCASLLKSRLSEQDFWPFSFPYGKADTYDDKTIELLKKAQFDCSYSTSVGSTLSGENHYSIKRLDPKDVPI